MDEALANDRDLARRFDLVREELAETIHLNETLGAPSARAMEKLFAAIDAEAGPARKTSFSQILAARVSDFMAGFSPRTLAWSASAAALAIMLQAAIITGMFVKEKSASHQLASHGISQPLSGSFALVRFAPQASMADITKFLETHKVSLVDGPKAGFYRIQVGPADLPRAEIARIVKQMEGNSVLAFIAVAD